MTQVEYEDPVVSTCQQIFGLPAPFPWQRLIIANVLDAILTHNKGQDEKNTQVDFESLRQIAVLPTGAGKSLCWMLPAVLSGKLTVAVFPLLSLMTDQKRRLDDFGVSVITMRGGLSQSERRAGWASLESGQISIVITNPEILQSSSVVRRLGELKPKFLVVDETHTVSQWGESFRPACAGIGRLVEQWDPPVVLALTATAGPHIRDRITELLFNGKLPNSVLANPDRPEIKYGVIPTLSRNHALERLVRNEPRPLIVFGPTRSSVAESARLLRRRLCSKEIRFYHAGLTPKEKLQLEAWFLDSEDGILCATCAYGMGVDKKNIRTVVHMAPPGSVEAYLQESGRASRDGKGAQAWLIWTPRDVKVRGGGILEDSGPAPGKNASSNAQVALPSPGEVIAARRRSMLQYTTSSDRCRRIVLLEALGIEANDCAGCDVCGKEAWMAPPEEEAILKVVKWNRRRFRKGQLARILIGKRSLEILRSGLELTRGFGALTGWEMEDVEEALGSLETAGKIRLENRWPWKSCLRLAEYPVRRRVPCCAVKKNKATG